ncbi:alpha/beta fold hydrolase [Candidatus Oscillochloris fontis]|uniref:alpha/beta fold hydrolase n=1 Tax=Candidatus Oscillochloris fontis TaxID=2496868 RepID=UPI00101BA6EA|nr:alpha/beta fold hydrolase [Candidatus Oscillochloris fontis]
MSTTTSDTPTTPMSEHGTSIYQDWLQGEHGPMRYWVSEPKRGVPVVFIHGYAAMVEHWKRIALQVARSHTFYALDLYGFGESARPRGEPSRERWAAQVATFIREVVGEPAVVVGHSMGGVVATEVARSYPDLTRALVLVNSSGMQMYERPPTFFDTVMMNALSLPILGEAVTCAFTNPCTLEYSVRQGLLSAYHNKERVTPKLVQTFTAPLRKYGASSYLAASRNFRGLTLEAFPGDVRAPTLLIWGAEDRSIPPSDAEAIKAHLIPQAEIVVLPATGHCPFDETPEAFCQAFLPWVDRV